MIDVNKMEDIDNEGLSFYENLQIVLEAINDWDREVETLEGYIESLKVFLGDTLKMNKDGIKEVLKSKDPLSNSWKMESVSILLDVFPEENSLLHQILDNLMKDLQQYFGSMKNSPSSDSEGE